MSTLRIPRTRFHLEAFSAPGKASAPVRVLPAGLLLDVEEHDDYHRDEQQEASAGVDPSAEFFVRLLQFATDGRGGAVSAVVTRVHLLLHRKIEVHAQQSGAVADAQRERGLAPSSFQGRCPPQAPRCLAEVLPSSLWVPAELGRVPRHRPHPGPQRQREGVARHRRGALWLPAVRVTSANSCQYRIRLRLFA